ncbi:hypothetical protein [Halomonas sp. I5-271120]|uniref:hypothetical protein n=1 Tax=Halomonas sp. I5-271120 TaxID=3061632 RepID=UPI00271559C6|nr:hypothetical protein [Halomonas sp. I5-271120]
MSLDPHKEPQDEALVRAIRLELEVDELRAALQQKEREADKADKAQRKAKHEADQLRARNEKLSQKLEKAQKDAKQAKHLAREELQKQKAKEKSKRGNASTQPSGEVSKDGPSVKSDDGKVTVFLNKDQVHIAQPPYFVVSSTPLSVSDKHQLEFCGLISGIRQSEYGEFAENAAQLMATRWRYQNNCMRVEDLDLPTKIATALSESGLERVADIQACHQAGKLTDIKGIGPAAASKIAEAVTS